MSKQPWHLTWKTVSVNGRRVHFGEAGDGPILVFLHGWGLGDKSYKRALNRLVRMGLRVVAPSLPGFGGSADLPKDEFTLEGYARWVAAFLDTIGIDEPVYLVGHSFGGAVSIRTAHDHPDRVRLLVLVNSLGGAVWKGDADADPAEAELAGLLDPAAGDADAAERPARPATPASPLRHLHERPLWDWGVHFPFDVARPDVFRKVVPVVLEDVVRNVVSNPLAFLRVAQLARTADLRVELETLRDRGLPVVVLWGSADKILPAASGEAMAKALGQTPETVHDGSHGWLLADPDQFGEVMTNVIAVAEIMRRRAERDAAAATGTDDLPGELDVTSRVRRWRRRRVNA